MATLQSTDISRKVPIPGFGAGGGQVRRQIATVSVTAATATTDVLQFFYLPPNSQVVGGWLKAADLDSGTTVTINVGDSGDADRYFAAATVGQAGTATETLAYTGLGYTNTVKTLVTGALAAGPSTTTGDLTLCLFYTCEEP